MKKEIVERLLKDGHINFDEALELMGINENQPVVVKEFHNHEVHRQFESFAPVYPLHWGWDTIMCDNNFGTCTTIHNTN